MRPITACLVIALIIAVAMVAGCGGGGSTSSSLSGTVVDGGTLQPLAGAVVVAGGAEATTDANGDFFIASISPGLSSINVSATGYVTQFPPVSAGSGDKSVGTVFLAPAPVAGAGNVTGIITEGGAPAISAVITSAGHSARSRANGTYVLYNVPSGFQTIHAVNAASTMAGSKNVTVISASTVVADIPLTTAPPPPPV